MVKKIAVSALAIAVFVIAAVACEFGNPEPTPTPTQTPTETAVPTSTNTPTAAPTAVATLTAPTPPTPGQSSLAVMIATSPDQRDPAQLASLLLSYVPDTNQSREGVWIADYENAAYVLGIEPPDAANDAEVDSYVTQVWQESQVHPGGYLAGFAWDNDVRRSRQDARPYVGFAQGDLSLAIIIGNGDRALEIALGDIDAERSRELIQSCAECPEPELVSHSVADFFSWGRDFEKNFLNRYAPPLFDGAGTGGRLAVSDFVSWRAASTVGIESLLDVAAGETPSLAESDDYLDLLGVMLSQDAVSVFLSAETVGRDDPGDAFANVLFPGFTQYMESSGLSEEQKAAFRQQVTGGSFPLPFSAYAVASAFDEGAFHTLIAYAYPSETIAQQSLVSLHNRFEEIRTIFSEQTYEDAFGGVSYSASGRIAIVRLELNAAVSMVENGEPIHLHE